MIGECRAKRLPSEWELLQRLSLNATDAARVCGVTVRQLTYWTDKGIIEGGSTEGRSYDIKALAKALSIKRAMLQGYPLEKAALLVEEKGVDELAGREVEVPDPSYIASLIAHAAAFRRCLQLYLAVARLRAAASQLASFDVASLYDAGSEENSVASKMAMRIDEVATLVDSTVRDLQLQMEQLQRERSDSGMGSTIR